MKQKAIFILFLYFYSLFSTDLSFGLQVDTGSIDVSGRHFSETGVLNIITEADTVFAYINGDYEEVIEFNNDEKLINLQVGSNEILIFGRTISQFTYRVEIEKESITELFVKHEDDSELIDESYLSAYAAYKSGFNLFVQTDSETEISFGSRLPAQTGSKGYKLSPGVYQLSLSHPSGRDKTELVTISEPHLMKVVEHYFKPTKQTAVISSVLLPGAGQFLKSDYFKGAIMTATAVSAITLTINRHLRLRKTQNEFDQLYPLYLSTNDENLATLRGDRLDVLDSRIQSNGNQRNLFLITFVLIYGFNIYDAQRENNLGFLRSDRPNPYRDFHLTMDQNGLQANIHISF